MFRLWKEKHENLEGIRNRHAKISEVDTGNVNTEKHHVKHHCCSPCSLVTPCTFFVIH